MTPVRTARRVEDPLISVVIPAFNAAATLRSTLESAMTQTYRNIEVIVVDDGSDDATPDIVHGLARRDSRVRLIVQANGGVASARNAGISASSGEFIAPLDADDLWHPAKLERQMAVFRDGDREIGFVYAPFRLIDRADRVIRMSQLVRFSGWVFLQHMHVNFVGNASSVLMRKSAVDEAGGYASWLREAGAHGCEDYLLQLRIAARHQVGVVPEYLVGYRAYDGSMSSNTYRMTLSRKLVLQSVLADCVPDIRWTGGRALADCDATLFAERPSVSHFRDLLTPDIVPTLGFRLTTHARRFAFRLAGKPLRGNKAPLSARPFFDFGPQDGPSLRLPGRLRHLMKVLAPMDAQYGPRQAYLAPRRPVLVSKEGRLLAGSDLRRRSVLP